MTELKYLLMAHSPHVVLLAETWLRGEIRSDCIVPLGYKLFRWDRDTRGVGAAIIVKSSIPAAMIECHICETVWCNTFNGIVYTIGSVYRPSASTPQFLDSLSEFLSDHVNGNTKLIMAGDFNLPHID